MTDVERRIAAHFDNRFLRSYAAGKLRTDPVYGAVLERVRGSSAPIFDIGCGVGLLEFFLRENGVANRITGIDHDSRKVASANAIASHYSGLEFRAGDARDPIPGGVSVMLLDVLHYFTDEDQRRILANAAAAVPPGGLVVIRDAIRDRSIRYRITAAQEHFSRIIRWLRAERLHFPEREMIRAPFKGFAEEIEPLWGKTPFNNYLFVFKRSGAGTTNR